MIRFVKFIDQTGIKKPHVWKFPAWTIIFAKPRQNVPVFETERNARKRNDQRKQQQDTVILVILKKKKTRAKQNAEHWAFPLWGYVQ